MRDPTGDRNDRRHFPQGESRKAPQHVDRQRSPFSDDTARPAVPALSPTHYSTFIEYEKLRGGGHIFFILLSVFSPPRLVSLYLSAVEYVTQRELSLRQLMQTRLIS